MNTETPDVINLQELAKTKPELTKAINALISDFSQSEDVKPEFTKAVRALKSDFSGSKDAENPGEKRFSIASLHPEMRKALEDFDFDKDGKLSVNEVKRGAELLKETKKKYKVALWTMIIQFVVYAGLTATSCGILYHFLDLMKDTAVDNESGSLMVKDESGVSEVAVSVESRGELFTNDGTALDAETGLEKECFSDSRVLKIFDNVAQGKTTRILMGRHESTPFRRELNRYNRALSLYDIGRSNRAMWTDESIDFGNLVFYPDAECTSALHGSENETAEDGNRLLSSDDLMELNLGVRYLIQLDDLGHKNLDGPDGRVSYSIIRPVAEA